MEVCLHCTRRQFTNRGYQHEIDRHRLHLHPTHRHIPLRRRNYSGRVHLREPLLLPIAISVDVVHHHGLSRYVGDMPPRSDFWPGSKFWPWFRILTRVIFLTRVRFLTRVKMYRALRNGTWFRRRTGDRSAGSRLNGCFGYLRVHIKDKKPAHPPSSCKIPEIRYFY